LYHVTVSRSEKFSSIRKRNSCAKDFLPLTVRESQVLLICRKRGLVISFPDDGLNATENGLNVTDDGLNATDDGLNAADDGLNATDDGLNAIYCIIL
jgi:uncharacterized phage infection (PIP) family protein YhgE